MSYFFLNELVVVVINVLGLATAFLVYFADTKEKSNRLFFWTALAMLLYTDAAFVSDFAQYLNFPIAIGPVIATWVARFDYAFSGIVMGLGFQLAINFPRRIDPPKWMPYLFYTILSFVFVLSYFSVTNVTFGEFYSNIINGPGQMVFLALATIEILQILWVLAKKYKQLEIKERRRVRYFFIGVSVYAALVLAFIVILPVYKESGYQNKYLIFGEYSAIVFLIFAAYSILSKKIFEVRIVLSELFVGVIGLVLIVLPFITTDTLAKILLIVVFIFYCIFAVLFIRSIAKEVRQKEFLESSVKSRTAELENIQEELRRANLDLERRVQERTEQLKNLTGQLEAKVSGRTQELNEKMRELEDSRKALINILDDVQASREELQKSRGRISLIIENLIDPLIVLDPFKAIEFVNRSGEVLIKEKRQVLVGKKIQDLSNDFVKKLNSCILDAKGDIKSLFREELSLNEGLVYQITTVGLGSYQGFLVIIHDVSREKVIEKMKTEFVSIAAHQLRTPLSAIKWALALLKESASSKMNTEENELLNRAEVSNNKMIDLVNDLLSVSRIEEGRYLYEKKDVSLNNILEPIINNFKELLASKKSEIKFSYRVDKDLPKIVADEEKITIVVQNLLENAFKYNKPNGSVILKVIYDIKEEEIVVSVADTGFGIPKDEQAMIFTKFYRTENVKRMDTEGSGLGLFIARNIIEAHGGKLWFESQENIGTTFFFTIPVRKEILPKEKKVI